MDKPSQPRPRDQIIASLRDCAAEVARTAKELAAKVNAEKFSCESEFSVSFLCLFCLAFGSLEPC